MSKNETTIYAPGLYDIVSKTDRYVGKAVVFFDGECWCIQLFGSRNYGHLMNSIEYYFPIAGAVMFGDAWIPDAIPLA